jgi:hypothetical protein
VVKEFLAEESGKYLDREHEQEVMRHQGISKNRISRDEEVTNAKKRVRVKWGDEVQNKF